MVSATKKTKQKTPTVFNEKEQQDQKERPRYNLDKVVREEISIVMTCKWKCK